MDIMLPNLAGVGPGTHLTGEGVVLRVDERKGGMGDTSNLGFAASVQFYPEPSESVLLHLKRSGQVM